MWVATPVTPPDRLFTGGTGSFDGHAAGLPDWEGAEAEWDPVEAPDWDPTELDDWDSADRDPAELAGWEPEDLEEEPLGRVVPGPATSAPEAERRGLGHA